VYHILTAQGQTQFVGREERDQPKVRRTSPGRREQLSTPVGRAVDGLDQMGHVARFDRREDLGEAEGKFARLSRKPQDERRRRRRSAVV